MRVAKVAGFALLLTGLSSFAFGAVPEIDPGSAAGVVALIGGAALIIRSRRRR